MSIDESELSDEQRQIVNHPIGIHARVLAGPGTGKSYTAAIFLGKLHDPASPVVKSKMLTFTRAATAEFAIKLVQHDLAGVADAPSTVHSHALAVLLNLSSGQLPSPLRIPDTWEMDQLVRLVQLVL